MKEQLLEGLEVSLWDRWEMAGSSNATKLIDVVKFVEQTYVGLEVRDILRGTTPLYFHAIMTAVGKEKEAKKVLNSTIHSLAESDPNDVYVDLTVTCVKKGDDKILKGVPPVRVYYKEKPKSLLKPVQDAGLTLDIKLPPIEEVKQL